MGLLEDMRSKAQQQREKREQYADAIQVDLEERGEVAGEVVEYATGVPTVFGPVAMLYFHDAETGALSKLLVARTALRSGFEDHTITPGMRFYVSYEGQAEAKNGSIYHDYTVYVEPASE